MKYRKAGPGWFLLAGYVAAYDLWAIRTNRETLSSAFLRAVQHPINKWPTIFVWAGLTAHLFNIMPDKYDPLHILAYFIQKYS